MHRTVLAVLAALASAAAAAPTCPPPGFDTRWNASNPFDLKQYVSAAWFPQQQSITSYQPSSNLYCVRAEYRIASNASDFIQVFNQARRPAALPEAHRETPFCLARRRACMRRVSSCLRVCVFACRVSAASAPRAAPRGRGAPAASRARTLEAFCERRSATPRTASSPSARRSCLPRSTGPTG